MRAIRTQRPQPKCATCNKLALAGSIKTKYGFIKWKKYCATCDRRYYRRFLKAACEFCGFKPIHICQLDVDHKNGNKSDNSEENLQTLCANCHRLKTQLNKEYLKKSK